MARFYSPIWPYSVLPFVEKSLLSYWAWQGFWVNILNLRLQGLRCGEEGCIIVTEDAFVFCGIGEYFQEYGAWALGGDEGVDALLHLLLILCLEIGDVVLQTDAFG